VALGGSTEDMVEQCRFFFLCFVVSIGGGGVVCSCGLGGGKSGCYR
jgi:hypothetical protein